MQTILSQRQEKGILRSLFVEENLIDFASNDYLGLSRSKLLQKNIIQEWRSIGPKIGSGGSRLLTGNSLYAEKLEKEIAAFHGCDNALLFSCGYMANVGLITAIATEKDSLFFDAFIHASCKEGIRLCKASSFPFKHNDLEHLEKRLQNSSSKGNRFICIESIYSTDGSIAPIEKIYKLSQKYEAKLIVDEAHSVGLFGKSGRGLLAKIGLEKKVYAAIVAFGKALGVYGAAILGSDDLKELLVNFAKPFIYSTFLPFYCLAAIRESYLLLPHLEKERTLLRELINLSPYSSSQIQPVPIGNAKKAKRAATSLARKGFQVSALVSPTVQRTKEVLRISLHAYNTKKELQALLTLLETI